MTPESLVSDACDAFPCSPPCAHGYKVIRRRVTHVTTPSPKLISAVRGGARMTRNHAHPRRYKRTGRRPVVAIDAPRTPTGEDARPWRPTAIMEAASRVLEDAPDSLNFNKIKDRVRGREQHVRTALELQTAGPTPALVHAAVRRPGDQPVIDHAAHCQRRRPPILRAGWNQVAELWCPDCGRTFPASDTRPTSKETPNA